MGAVGLVAVLTWNGAACSVIPTGDKAIAVDNERKSNPLGDPYARVIAMPPSPSWTAEEVVTGFRAAMASVDDPRREVARKYLTDDFAGKWNPLSGVTVYKQEEYVPTQEGEKETRVTLKGTVTAMIDQDGRYWPKSTTLNEPFTLVKGAGGWRISSAPDGLMLSEADVDRAYLKVDLYFLDSAWKGLVADQVRVPIDPSSNFAKTTVERLLKGPSSLLRKAVNSAFRPGTELIDVTTDDNRVVVDLTKPVDSDRIAPMSAQLAATLSGLTNGGWGFEIRVNGELYYSDTALQIAAQEQSDFDPWMTPGEVRPYYLAGGALWQLGNDKVGRQIQVGEGEMGDARIRPAISNQGQVAALSKDGTKVSVAPLTVGGKWQDRFTGDSLTPPSWDRYDTLWTVDRPSDHSSTVLRTGNDGKQYRVTVPDLDTVYVKALKVARDGVHVAVVVKNGTGEEEVEIGTIVGRGGDTRITDLQSVVSADGGQTIKDIAWKDGKSLYVLTGKSELLEASVTDEPKSLASNARIETITALDGSLLAGAVDDNGNRQVLSWNRGSAKWEAMVKEGGSTDFTEKGPSSPAYPLG
ncbi:LpqB family beta-propeller domain-containing protein [Streptosporangium sp. NBC_01639]|uniref:LpqB family beta-propeller domain-containing protein n=1 Tax=Streptosporangium sp. NBC_01639 TaxID=2975948 RepID=UPI003864B891|nr:LpqB family beta-propeller domain-containing protein [Streptosporangium sp. NBC_01639]